MKKIWGLFLIGVIFFSTIGNVDAKVLPIHDVSTKFNSLVTEELAQLGLSVTSSIDPAKKTLDIYSEGVKVFSFKYGDDYIEYDNRNAVATEGGTFNDVITAAWTSGIVKSILDLSGYEGKTISLDNSYDYDTYGIEFDIEDYSFNGTLDNGGTWSENGMLTKYFKMSLDTDKIDALMAKYGVDEDEEDSDNEIMAGLIPTLEAEGITENSVILHPTISNLSDNLDSEVYCYVYRSTSEDGEYERLFDMGVNCSNEVGIIDAGLDSNTTYYYKALVAGGTKYSNVLKVTTKSATEAVINTTTKPTQESRTENLKTNQESTVENPKTGLLSSNVIMILTIVGSIGSLIYIRKSSVFRKI